MTDKKELFAAAEEALKYAYAPYSEFKVGAALLTSDGTIFTGVNVENVSYGATICAERTAIVKAVSEGHREFESMALISSKGAVLPCGICRQFISEFSKDMLIFTGSDKLHIKEYRLGELYPEIFEL